MSWKDKLLSFLSGFQRPVPKKSEPAENTAPTEPVSAPQAAPEKPAAVPDGPSHLELPMDHPIRQLHELRREQAGSLPGPRLCMDEDGVLPPEAVKKEKPRLQSSLSGACGARLKAARGKLQGKRRKKGEAEEDAPVLDAYPWLYLSSDKVYAWMLVFPPVGQGEELSRDMVYRALSEQNISYGLQTALLDRMAHDRDRYFNLFLVAKGTPAFDGRNGNIVDNFPRALQRTLDTNEYGQVDYSTLNLICNVDEGQEICRLIRPTEGEPGRTVTDQEIPAKSGRAVPLPKGRNTEISEDGESLIASISGHVEFINSCFQVKPVMDIDGDVDFSTGNIKFVGDVNIKGDVLSGFTVKSMGNVYVGGVVEAGCTVEAGGDLTVVQGILGDGTTVIRAGRCLFSKYIENVTILVRENLQADCIVNSKIYCDGEVIIRSGRGSILGGQVWAAKRVSAGAIGARSEVKTSISLGGMPCDTLEQTLVQQKLTRLKAEMERLEAQLDSPAKASLMGKVRMKISVSENRLQKLQEELAAARDDSQNPAEQDGGRLECGIAYVGTEIRFGKQSLRIQQETRQLVAKLACGEIVTM